MEKEEKEEKLLNYYKYLSVKLALKMYDTFAQELFTALKNTGDIMTQIKWTSRDVQSISYYSGKEDAFGEIAERVMKEYNLAKMGLDTLNETDKDNFYNTYSKNEELIEHVFHLIKRKKNEDVDKIFPDDNYRGSQFGREILRKKGQVADLLESYACEAFCNGIIAERKFKEILPESPEYAMTPENFNAEVERAKSGLEFDPEDFAIDLSDSVIDAETKGIIYHPGNLGNIYSQSPHYKKVKELKNKIFGERIFDEIKKTYTKKDKKDNDGK